MKRPPVALIVLLWLLMMFVATFAQVRPFEATARVQWHDTYDTRGVQFFELVIGQERVVVSADWNTALARWLRDKDRVRLVLTPVEPQTLDR
jgi:hypothetical protein